MRILILTQYYPPEIGAPQNRLSDLAQRLTRWGHGVTVLTALPNYPHGVIYDGYRGRFWVEEALENITVLRSWIYASKNKGFAHRLVNYFSFVCSSVFVGLCKLERHDVVIVESPPLFLGISGFLLGIFKRAKLVFNVSDLWPESAIAMGIVNNKVLIKVSRWLEEFLYRRSSLITGQTQGIVDNIRSRFCSKPVALITNGVNVDSYLRASSENLSTGIRAEFGFGEKFVIGYAGLHGLAQGLETVILTANLLSGYDKFLFAFVGEGPEKEKLRKMSRELKLINVMFLPLQPATRIPAIVSSFDVAVIPLKRLSIFKGALPSKMFEAMAAAVPIVVAVDGEARTLVEKAEAGLTVEPENPRAIADGIQRLYQDEYLRKNLGLNGQRYVMEHYDREKIARHFERLLLEVHRFQPAITTRSPVTACMNHGLVKSFINKINRQKAE